MIKFLIFSSLIFAVKCRNFDIAEDLQMHMAHKVHVDQLSDDNAKFASPTKPDEKEKTADYWNADAQKSLKHKLDIKLNKNVAKNVILFLGDGMSIPTLAATRVYLGGEEQRLSFEKFPYVGLSKTYCVDSQVADSACSATAYLCGVKGNILTVGVTAAVKLNNCTQSSDPANKLTSIASWSQLAGKKTGLVTTTRITHASPSGVYANSATRFWESDTEVLLTKENPETCADIARQLVENETGKKLNVVMGGGREFLLPKEETDDEGLKGHRSDKKNLIKIWQQNKNSSKAKYIWNREQLLNLPEDTEDVLGLFAGSHIDFNLDRNKETVPSLEEMTEGAIKILKKGEKGYFLFVEGGHIDTAHHETKPKKSIDETAEFSKAVQKAVDITDEKDTLIIVTSDHAHTLSISGYPLRKTNIFSYGGEAKDQMPYLTLNYANGPNVERGHTNDVGKDDIQNKDYTFPGIFPVTAETHGGDDVGIFARGPWAFLFTGVNEQNMIPHMAAFASCVGEGDTVCKHEKKTE